MQIFLYFLFVCLVHVSWQKSIVKRSSTPDLDDYLSQYGYVAHANFETGALRSKDELTNAIKNLQKMGGLPMNGDPNDPALKELLEKDRCGVKDNKVNQDPYGPQQFQISNFKWDKKVVTWKIIRFSGDLNREEQERKFYEAFDIWHQVADISFRQVNENEEADIVISFDRYDHGDGYPLDGKGSVLAHAFPPGPGRGGDAHFDEDELWSTNGNPADSTDLYTVAAHEFGHSLGIYHSEKKGALMYPWYQGYNPNMRLDYDDIQAIQTIYGGPPRNRETKEPPRFTFKTYPSTKPTTTTPVPRVPTKPDGVNPPDPCTTTIDDVALIRGNTFAFKDRWYWRFDNNGQLMADDPYENQHFWVGLPVNKTLNAVTDIHGIDLTIFFIGTRYWLLRARHLLSGFPKDGRSISQLGIDTRYVKNIDAAMMWGYNQRVYIFSGDIYWRLSNEPRHMRTDGSTLRVDQGYPKSFDLWQGIPVPIDGAYTNNKNETFFFKGTQYWGFDDKTMTAKKNYPKDIAKMLTCVYGLRRNTASSYSTQTFIGLLFVSLLITLLK